MSILLDSTDSRKRTRGRGGGGGVKTKKKRKTHQGKTMKIAKIPFMCPALGVGEIIKKSYFLFFIN